MSIAVDHSRLRRIIETVLPGATLDRAEATTILQIAQLAAGIELDQARDEEPAERAALRAIGQHMCSLVGVPPEEVLPIPAAPDDDIRSAWLSSLAARLETRGARELAFALAFLVSVADLELSPDETSALEDVQRALALDDERATDLVVVLSEIVAAA
jgi:tellurite resistance protein